MNIQVALINYGMNNINSVRGALENSGASVKIVLNGSELKGADKIVLPGVGVFADAIKNLRYTGIYDALHEEVLGKKKPLLGICLGMQLLADCGTEGGEEKGLGFISGHIEKLIPSSQKERIPHVGWNEVLFVDDKSLLLTGIPSGSDFYFVHSYHFITQKESSIIGRSSHGNFFNAIVQNDIVFGTQFHPEKSFPLGHKLLHNFLRM